MFVAKKSLFDLLSHDPSVDHSIYLDENSYIASIVQDIGNLLNTRCVLPKSKRKTHLPLNYGLPYMFGMQEPNDMMNPQQQEQWKTDLEQTLRYFEPRLHRPKVTLQKVNTLNQSIDVSITGEVIIQGIPKRTTFPFVVYNIYS